MYYCLTFDNLNNRHIVYISNTGLYLFFWLQQKIPIAISEIPFLITYDVFSTIYENNPLYQIMQLLKQCFIYITCNFTMVMIMQGQSLSDINMSKTIHWQWRHMEQSDVINVNGLFVFYFVCLLFYFGGIFTAISLLTWIFSAAHSEFSVHLITLMFHNYMKDIGKILSFGNAWHTDIDNLFKLYSNGKMSAQVSWLAWSKMLTKRKTANFPGYSHTLTYLLLIFIS